MGIFVPGLLGRDAQHRGGAPGPQPVARTRRAPPGHVPLSPTSRPIIVYVTSRYCLRHVPASSMSRPAIAYATSQHRLCHVPLSPTSRLSIESRYTSRSASAYVHSRGACMHSRHVGTLDGDAQRALQVAVNGTPDWSDPSEVPITFVGYETTGDGLGSHASRMVDYFQQDRPIKHFDCFACLVSSVRALVSLSLVFCSLSSVICHLLCCLSSLVMSHALCGAAS
eukprot:3165228-Rhodomonas_salina.2